MKCNKCSTKLNELENNFSRMLNTSICAGCAGVMNKTLPIQKRIEHEIERAELYAVDDDPKTYSYFKGYSNGLKWVQGQIED